jgi:hypothetical protein
MTCTTQMLHVPVPGFPSGGAFPPASRAALSPREPLVEGMGENSSNGPPTGLSASMTAARSGTNIPRVTELSPGGPHDAGSSSSSPAGERSTCCNVPFAVRACGEAPEDLYILSELRLQPSQGHAAGSIANPSFRFYTCPCWPASCPLACCRKTGVGMSVHMPGAATFF